MRVIIKDFKDKLNEFLKIGKRYIVTNRIWQHRLLLSILDVFLMLLFRKYKNVF